MTVDNSKFIDLAEPNHLGPDGKLKRSRKKVPRGSTLWDHVQKNANEVISPSEKVEKPKGRRYENNIPWWVDIKKD